MQGAERRLLYFLDLLSTQINMVSVPPTTWNHNTVPGLVFKCYEGRLDTFTHCKQFEVSAFSITITGWEITSNLCLIQQKLPVSGSAQVLFWFESSVIPLTSVSFQWMEDVKSQGKDLTKRNLSQSISATNCVHLTTSRISVIIGLVPYIDYSDICTHRYIWTYTDIDVYIYRCMEREKEAERDLAVKFSYISSRYKTYSWIFSFICFTQSPEHHPGHPKHQALHKCLSSPFPNSWYFKPIGKTDKKLQKEQRKEDEVNSKIDYGPATNTAHPGVGLH